MRVRCAVGFFARYASKKSRDDADALGFGIFSSLCEHTVDKHRGEGTFSSRAQGA
jgi:hypothetical protein